MNHPAPPAAVRRPFPAELLGALQSAFGERVSTAEAVRTNHGRDESPFDPQLPYAVVFARNTKAAQRVHAQFADHHVRKVYWALVEGTVSPDAGVWDDWIRKLAEESRVERAKEGDEGAKLATLEYKVLKVLPDCTLVELSPLTGRMHQLRVQAAWRGHPVLGDAQYGSGIFTVTALPERSTRLAH